MGQTLEEYMENNPLELKRITNYRPAVGDGDAWEASNNWEIEEGDIIESPQRVYESITNVVIYIAKSKSERVLEDRIRMVRDEIFGYLLDGKYLVDRAVINRDFLYKPNDGTSFVLVIFPVRQPCQ